MPKKGKRKQKKRKRMDGGLVAGTKKRVLWPALTCKLTKKIK